MLMDRASKDLDLYNQEFQTNEIMPWNAKLNYYSGGTQQYDPFAAKMSYYDDEKSIGLAQYQGELNRKAAERQGWLDLAGSIIGFGKDAAVSLATSGAGGG
jgi:hypothetical protein